MLKFLKSLFQPDPNAGRRIKRYQGETLPVASAPTSGTAYGNMAHLNFKSGPVDMKFIVRPRTPGYKWRKIQMFLEVAGTNYRYNDAMKFAQAAIDNAGNMVYLKFVRDPENEFDPNAILIFGRTPKREYSLGFVPREAAAELAKIMDPPSSLPIGAELHSVAIEDKFIKIRFVPLEPAKADPIRKK